jgi:glycosyltransferase involved in cell wall biosynthesis
VHYGVKPRFFPDEKLRSRTRKKLKISEDAFVVLHPSVFEKRKGHYYTIRAFSELLSKHPSAKLILAGNDGFYFEHVTTLIRKYKISDSVLLPGFYSPFEELLSVVDVLCLPSQEYDTTPYVILLALACKIPVITTDREDFADILFDGYNALLVPTGNYESISTKLIDLAEGKVDIEELTKNGVETYQRLFREESMVSEKVKIIRTI